MGKPRSYKVKCLTSLQLGWDSNSGTLALVYGLSHSAVLSVTSWAVLASYWLRWCRSALPPMMWEQKGTERNSFCHRMESILENGAQCMEIWEEDFHLKPGKIFLSWQSHPAKERLFWAGTSPSITKTSNISWVPPWQWCSWKGSGIGCRVGMGAVWGL